MIYLQCTCYNPPETASKPSGGDYNDLHYVYMDLDRTKTIIEQYETQDPEIESWDAYQTNTAEFLSQHPDCVIQVVDEKGQVLHKYW